MLKENLYYVFNVKKVHVEAAAVSHIGSMFGAKVAISIVPHVPEFEAKMVNATQDVPIPCQIIA